MPAGAVLALLLAVAAGLVLDRAGMLPEAAREPLEAAVAMLTGEEVRTRPSQPAPGSRSAPPPGFPSAPTGSPDAAQLDAAADALALIQVRPERRPGYRRDDWPHWLDVDGNCLNTREEVLVARSARPSVLSRDRCSIVEGLWIDPYDGRRYTSPRDVDIDHVVALQEAHDSGGWAWNRERRAAFANDLSDPRTLVVTGSSINREKGAKGPEDWLPPDPARRCRYIVDWIAIKLRWELAMDEREHGAVETALAACRSGEVAEAP